MSDKPDLKQMMELAQQVQKSIQDMQKSMANKEVTAVAGTGDITVEVVMNCESQVKKVKISEGALKEGPEILEGLLISAFNSGVNKAKSDIQKELAAIYRSSGIPTGKEEE